MSAVVSMRQIPLDLGPRPEPGFDNFVPGANAAALAHLRQALAGELPWAPVYLWGPAGSGKSHLLKSLARAGADAGRAVLWVGGQAGAGQELPDQQPECTDARTLVLVDDSEALPPAGQQAAFVLFEQARAEGALFAAAGRWPPVDLPLRDDLRTRLGWGHIFAMQALGEDETREALRHEARRRGFDLGEDFLRHLMIHFPRDLGSLMPLLDRLDDYALSAGRPVTLPLLRQMLAEQDR